MHSWLSRTARIRCERELYRPPYTPKAAHRVLGRLGDVKRGRETHRHDYTRPLAALSDELGGLSTSLVLFASPPLILSTESVVVMEGKGMITAIATRAASLGRPQEMQVASAESALLRPMSWLGLM